MPIADPRGPKSRPTRFGNANGQPAARRTGGPPARQLYDLQKGTRNGELAPLMRAVAANLSGEDLVNILAYVSSRTP